MRVLHLLKTGTGAMWAWRQMRELVLRGVEVHALMPEGPTTDLCRESGIQVHLHDFVKAASRLNLRRIAALVHEVEPDLLNSHFVATTVLMRLALGRRHPVPRFFHVPGPLHLENPLLRRLEILSAGRSDFWIASSRAIASFYLNAGVDTERVFFAYYGVDVERFRTKRTGALRRDLRLEADTPVVGMVSFVYRPRRLLGYRQGIKGHEDLVEAFKPVLSDIPEARLVFVGGPWLRAERYARDLQEWAIAQLGDRVIFTGTRGDVPDIYPDFDVAVHPSHSDNAVAVESLMARVPTVATDVGGQSDLVRPGSTGWLVPPYRPDLLAKAIIEVLSNPAEAARSAERGRRRSEKLMDARKNAGDVLSAYESVLSRRTAG